MTDRSSAIGLLPLVLFLALFMGAGIYYTVQGSDMAFYQLRAPVAILPALGLAAWLAWRQKQPVLDTLLEGMGERNVLLMCLIFLLAGAFATILKEIGAVDAVVALGLDVIPPAWLLPGLFVVTSFVALSIGTSMGCIAAIVPIAVGIGQAAGLDIALVVGTVIGGAMFGDNLSIISDTTIAATRSQGAAMRDKFRENFWIALPASSIVLLVLFLSSGDVAEITAPAAGSYWLILPYVAVLALALIGLDVVLVLSLGILMAGGAGLLLVDDYSVVRFINDIWAGYESMIEITLLSLFIGGLAHYTRSLGGLNWLANGIKRLARGRTGRVAGELSIASLSSAADILTANNTVAILVAGPVAKKIAEEHQISPRHSASLLDIFACVAQGLIPYGAQILLAASLASLSPLVIMSKVYYCWILGIVAILFILIPRRKPH